VRGNIRELLLNRTEKPARSAPNSAVRSGLYETGPSPRGLLWRVAFVEAARFLGGQVLVSFSVERLMDLLTALDRDPSAYMGILWFSANRDRAKLDGFWPVAELKDGKPEK